MLGGDAGQNDAADAGVDQGAIFRTGKRAAAIDSNLVSIIDQVLRQLFEKSLEAAVAVRDATSA